MAEEIIEQGYRELADTILEHNPGVDLGRVRAAFELADRAHSGQKRKAGTPYVTHCVAAAQICAEMGLDEDSIVAALLHDCIEDTAITHEDIARQFGAEVADIVEGVTKLTRVQFTSREDEQMENLRKMLMAMAKDIRVILIKIADRLHNMRTMEYMVAQKQLEKSLETMEIYAPIAHRLGLQKVKWELEDLSLKYLDPDGYREIITYLDSKADVLNEFMSDVKKKITDRLTEYSIHATVQSRIKHTYSIYRKMYTQKRGLDEIFDLCAFRVIVDDIPDCYNVLGHIHDMFRPCRAASRTTLPRPSPTATRACIRPSSARRASCSRCRSAPGRCTASANTASPRTGSTNPAAQASAPEMRRSSPGSAACSKRSRTPTRRTSFTISKWTCSTTRFSYSRRRATW